MATGSSTARWGRAAFLLVFVAVMGSAAWWQYDRQRVRADRSAAVARASAQVLAAVVGTENAARDYIVTRDTSLLAAYDAGRLQLAAGGPRCGRRGARRRGAAHPAGRGARADRRVGERGGGGRRREPVPTPPPTPPPGPRPGTRRSTGSAPPTTSWRARSTGRTARTAIRTRSAASHCSSGCAPRSRC